jgi:hypothetical protein
MTDLLEISRKLCDDNYENDKNLFEMANIKEYRHSAILGYLIDRKERGHRIHLENFLRRLKFDDAVELSGKVDVFCEELIDCNNRRRPIDILVSSKDKKFALIIENKCRGASDQDAQIRDYWCGVKNMGFDEKGMYVLYLPPFNTFSSPSDNSLGEMKERFSVKEDLIGHLMTYSYRDLILPWLKEDVLPNISYGSGVLVDSLRCYIDLLEGMFAVRTDKRDVRTESCLRFERIVRSDNPSELWEKDTECLKLIDEILSSSNNTEIAEKDANRLGALQSKLWEIRSVLREKNPLLDPPYLSYEVYWLLRKNPTSFASQYIRSFIDTGLFFQSGQKQSTWDSVQFKEYWIECCFHVEEFAKFCKGEECGTILTFGIGNVGEEDFSILQNIYPSEYLCDKRWRSVFIQNIKFRDASRATGGEMLWAVAKTVAEEAKNFSDALRAVVDDHISFLM